MSNIAAIKCTSVIAQVNLGYYDADGNLLGEETFPQSDGNVLTAKLFYPHGEQLALLIEACIEQARTKLNAQGAMPAQGQPGNDAALDGRVPAASLMGDESEGEAT